MKKIATLSIITCLMVTGLFAQEKENESIKKVIQSAYIDGLMNKGDLDNTKKGFHPGFNLLGMDHNMLSKFPIYSWIEVTEIQKKASPEGPELKFISKFPMIDVTGNAAIVKVELYKESELIYTDYLSLYKFEEGWRIVSKIYFQHK